jgi:hypothetical protein
MWKAITMFYVRQVTSLQLALASWFWFQWERIFLLTLFAESGTDVEKLVCKDNQTSSRHHVTPCINKRHVQASYCHTSRVHYKHDAHQPLVCSWCRITPTSSLRAIKTTKLCTKITKERSDNSCVQALNTTLCPTSVPHTASSPSVVT